MNDNSDLSILGQNVDKSQVPPIEQKRMVAFINHFVVKTVDFLNEFMVNVESKFLEFDSKLQTIETSLQIVEAKVRISSVSLKPIDKPMEEKPQESKQTENEVKEDSQPSNETEQNQIEILDEPDKPNGVKAREDTRYRKYFKMLQVGVPPPAVKLKMSAEGFDPDILDDPNRILEDGTTADEV